ncbi:SAM-dependent methyltransferase [Paenibacillus sp. CAA11]|uniref:class I SAM-dependent methyltransferase n=1 Tax=Paenibacillus sp. CAA11 TaxID=1532905 RepID=UPI000D39D53E|nr:class I SAM-dependent methyltransferase [Paenibacillus sp. CAA11]AWB46541.1 SAM-dependent methyltransferase [Paenibacillus sp. CAA11]
MNESDYRVFYDRVGKINGWDFSKVKCRVEGAAWDFYHEVARHCRKSDVLLDIGTGGGEALLAMADAALLMIGIDSSAGMIKAGSKNLEASGKKNVRLLQMDAAQLEFPAGFFDVVSCRHSPFSSQEAARVLTQGGVFLTQQVSEADKRNLVQAFGRGQHSAEDGTLKNRYLDELRQAGFREIESYEYDATEYYQTIEDLLFLVLHTPTIPNFGEERGDYAVLDRFVAENQTDLGIRTNGKRFMIIARK